MVIDFLQTTDFLVFITQSSFQKLLRDNDSKILDSQGMAYGYIFPSRRERLSPTNPFDGYGDSPRRRP